MSSLGDGTCPPGHGITEATRCLKALVIFWLCLGIGVLAAKALSDCCDLLERPDISNLFKFLSYYNPIGMSVKHLNSGNRGQGLHTKKH